MFLLGKKLEITNTSIDNKNCNIIPLSEMSELMINTNVSLWWLIHLEGFSSVQQTPLLLWPCTLQEPGEYILQNHKLSDRGS